MSTFGYSIEYRVTMPTDDVSWYRLFDSVMAENAEDYDSVIDWAVRLTYEQADLRMVRPNLVINEAYWNEIFNKYLIACTEEWLVQYMVAGFGVGNYTKYVEEIDDHTWRL